MIPTVVLLHSTVNGLSLTRCFCHFRAISWQEKQCKYSTNKDLLSVTFWHKRCLKKPKQMLWSWRSDKKVRQVWKLLYIYWKVRSLSNLNAQVFLDLWLWWKSFYHTHVLNQYNTILSIETQGSIHCVHRHITHQCRLWCRCEAWEETKLFEHMSDS